MAELPVLHSSRNLFPALWYVLGPIYQETESSGEQTPNNQSLRPQLSAFLSIFSFLTVDSG